MDAIVLKGKLAFESVNLNYGNGLVKFINVSNENSIDASKSGLLTINFTQSSDITEFFNEKSYIGKDLYVRVNEDDKGFYKLNRISLVNGDTKYGFNIADFDNDKDATELLLPESWNLPLKLGKKYTISVLENNN